MCLYDYAIIFNGEIYNYLEIKNKLKKGIKIHNNLVIQEVLLKSYIYYGLEFLKHLEGMWSFVIFNKKAKKYQYPEIDLVKSHYFILRIKKNSYFGSEIKFIKSLSNEKLEANDDHLLKYLAIRL